MKKSFMFVGFVVASFLFAVSLEADIAATSDASTVDATANTAASSHGSCESLLDSLLSQCNITDSQHLERLKTQCTALPSSANGVSAGFLKNKSAVEQTSRNGIVFTQKTIESFEKDFDSTVPQVDLFELDNLRIALLSVLNKAFDKKSDSRLHKEIDELGTPIRDALDTLRTNLSNNWSKELSAENLSEEECKQQRLWYTYKTLKAIHEMILAKTAVAATFFTKFIYGMMMANRVAFLRIVAAKIMESSKQEIENATQKTTKSINASLGAEASYGGAKAGINASVNKSEAMTDTSFYQMKVGSTLKLNVGAGIGKFFAQFNVSLSVANAAIFYSLEQLMDSGEFDGAHLKLPAIKEVAKSREKMQKREKELLSIFNGYIEAFLKDRDIGVVSSFATMLFPIITKSLENETAKSAQVSVGGEISIASIGLTLSRIITKKTHTRKFGILSLIEDDCSPSCGYKTSDITRLLGATSDRSSKYLEQISEHRNEIGNYDESALAIILNNILDDVKRYNSCLSRLADPSSNRKARELAEGEKHRIESRWLAQNNRVKSEGREGVLRSLVATVSNLREFSKSSLSAAVFNSIYEELCKLGALCEFSKDKSKRNAEFGSDAEAQESAWSGSLAIPGGIEIKINKTHAEGHPFMEDNGEFIDLEITLPMTILGLVGIKVVQSKLLSVFGALSKQKGEVSEGLGNAGAVVQDVLVLLTRNSAIPFISNVMGMIPIGTSKLNIRLRRLDVFSCSSPLPGTSEIIDRTKNRWEILYIQTMALSNSGLMMDSLSMPDTFGSLQEGTRIVQEKIGGKISNAMEKVGSVAAGIGDKINNLPVSVQLSFERSLGKRERIIGSNSLFYPVARYNVAKLGNSKTQWENFTTEQAQQLWLLFANICNTDSDARYELQTMYNKILKGITSSSERDSGEKIFKNFLKTCESFADLPIASKAFVDFLPLYNKFAKGLKKCREAAQKVKAVKFKEEVLLGSENQDELGRFIEELLKCRTSSSFKELYENYRNFLKWCYENTKGRERHWFKKLRNEMSSCNKCSRKMLDKKYFEICEEIAEKVSGCRMSSEYANLLQQFRASIQACSESPLKLASDNGASEVRSEESSMSLEELSLKDEESEESAVSQEISTSSSKKGSNNDGELPSNYEKIINELDAVFLNAINSENSESDAKTLNDLMLAISESKKGIPADYESNKKSIEENVKNAMESANPDVVAAIASINPKVQKLLADIVRFNKGILVVFSLLRSVTEKEFTKTLKAFEKVLDINYEKSFLPERKKKFGAVSKAR